MKMQGSASSKALLSTSCFPAIQSSSVLYITLLPTQQWMTISRNSFLQNGSPMPDALNQPINQLLQESLAKVQKYLTIPVEEDILVEDKSKRSSSMAYEDLERVRKLFVAGSWPSGLCPSCLVSAPSTTLDSWIAVSPIHGFFARLPCLHQWKYYFKPKIKQVSPGTTSQKKY